MFRRSWVVARVGVCLSLGGCGTRVPDIAEFWGDADSSHLAVNAVANQLQCELKRAIQDAMGDRVAGPSVTQLISRWVVQVNLNLTIQERTEFNPGVTLTSPLAPVTNRFSSGTVTTNQSFSLGIGVTSSADTIRFFKQTFVYRVSDLAMSPYGTDRSLDSCVQHMPSGYLMTQTDLKIADALRDGIIDYQTQGASGAIPPQAIVHQVTFKIATAGGITPTWRLLRATASNNSGTSLFGATRNRTQDVIFTLGPAATQQGPAPTLAQPAQNAALAAEIGSAVARSLESLR